MKEFKLNFFVLILPVSLNCLLFNSFNFRLLFFQSLILILAELVRQWLWNSKSFQPEITFKKRLFFFGIIYNNSILERFFDSKPIPTLHAHPKKILAYALMSTASFLTTKYAAAGSSNYFHLVIISAIPSIWILCKNPEQLNRLLLFNLFINSLFFLNDSQASLLVFTVWFVSHLSISFVLQKLSSVTEKKFEDLFSRSDFTQPIAAFAVLGFLFIAFNTLIPVYNQNGDAEKNASKNLDSFKSASNPKLKKPTNYERKAELMKQVPISSEALSSIARVKSKTESINIKQALSEIKSKAIKIPQSDNTAGAGGAEVEGASRDLQYFSDQLKKNKTLSKEDLKTLGQLAKNISIEEQEWQRSLPPQSRKEIEGVARNVHSNTLSTELNVESQVSSFDGTLAKYEKVIQEFKKENQGSQIVKAVDSLSNTSLSDTIPSNPTSSNPNPSKLNPDTPSESAQVPATQSTNEALSAEELTKTRAELAEQMNQLIEKEQKISQQKEELKVLSFFEKLQQQSLKIIISAIFLGLIVYLVSQKFSWKSKNAVQINKASIPAAARRVLKDIYKALLRARLNPTEEALKSYYLVEMAMKEINFPRTEDLPPQIYFEKINQQFPFIGAPVKVATQLFNRVFYGEKTPSSEDIIALRSSVKELMRKLQVI